MSKGSSENLIKYFIFLSSQVNKYWSGRLHIISKFSSETQKNKYVQWDSSCIIITFQHAALCWKVQKLQQLGVSMIGNIASFAHSNGNILLLLLFVIRPVLQLPHTTANHQNSLRFCFCFLFWIIFVAFRNSQRFTMPPLVCLLRKQKFHTDNTLLPRSR